MAKECRVLPRAICFSQESDGDSATIEQLQKQADKLHARFGIKVDPSSRMSGM